MMRKQYTAAFKARVVQELLKEEKTFAQIAAEYEVHPTQLKNWRAVALEGLPGFFEKQDSMAELRRAYEQQLTELYAEIGKLTTQVAWLKKSYNSDFANQWAETIQQAGEDSEDRTVKYWGELLITGLNDREEKPWEKWITMLSELLNHHKIDLKSRSSLLQFRASAYFNSQQYEQALVDLEQLTQIQPDYAWNWFLKAITLLQVGRREELSHAFARLDEVDPNFMPNLLRQYVEQLAAIGRSDEFIEELRSKIDEHDLLQNNRE